MGYSTSFTGEFTLNKPLTPEHKAYLTKFAETRRMKRDPGRTAELPDPVRLAAGLGIGRDAGYYVGSTAPFGQDNSPGIIDCNAAPDFQPGLWCQWVPNDDGTAISWDGGGKFYDYVEWIEYLIEHFLKPWGYVLNGDVEWNGEERNDIGLISIKDNKVTVRQGRIVYE